MGESVFLRKESCPNCGSRDNLARYSDGHGYCFGCNYREKGDDDMEQHDYTPPPSREPAQLYSGIVPGSYVALPKRGLSLDQCRRWSYQKGALGGDEVQLANYLDDFGAIIAQQIRTKDKEFPWRGDKDQGLYGKWMWKGFPRRRVVVFEGPIDAITGDSVSNGQFASVSVPNGAQGAAKALKKDLTWLSEFDEVVLCLDMDEPGRKAVADCAKLFAPGKAYIAELPLKDASDMLQAGRGGELFKCLLNAKRHKPAQLVSARELIDDGCIEDPVPGVPWWMPSLNECGTYGRRYGEIYLFGAGVGVGKTDWFCQQIEFDMNTLGEKVGVFLLEQGNSETILRVAGKQSGHCFHIPDDGWTKEQRAAALKKMRDDDRLYLQNHFGACDWAEIEAGIRYWYHVHGIRHFYIDHLTALAAAEEDERKGLEQIMARMGRLVKELPIMIHCISHLTTPEGGKSHEEGARIRERDFKGSRAIMQWAHFMFGLERNKQEEDDAKKFTTFRVLKDRYTGRSNGKTMPLHYNAKAGRLVDGMPPISGFDTPTGPSDF